MPESLKKCSSLVFFAGRHTRRLSVFLLSLLLLLLAGLAACTEPGEHDVRDANGNSLQELPQARVDGDVSLESAIAQRRSIRAYTGAAMPVQHLAQLFWAMQGITSEGQGLRTTPSAGATYPLETLAVVGNVEELDAGVYRYHPQQHAISKIADGDQRAAVSAAALNQNWMDQAAVIFIVTAVPERTTAQYGERGEAFVKLEAGHAAQNLHLQAQALGYGSTPVGAFDDNDLMKAAGLSGEENPLYLLPVGEPEQGI